MKFYEFGEKENPAIFLFPGTCCHIMSKKASNFQKKVMSLSYRGKEIFKPLNTGWIDDHVACVREWVGYFQ